MTRDPKFAAIYTEHAAHVWRLARHFGVPPEQLHDVAQEVWVSVFRQLESVDLTRPLKPWLTAVVWNHVRHLRRGYARHMRKAQALTDAETAREAREEPMSRSEAAWTLEAVLRELPEDQREVLMLCDGEGLSAPEVSEALGAPLNTIYSRLRLARRRCQAFAATLGAAGWALLIQRHCLQQGPAPGELDRLSAALSGPIPAQLGPVAAAGQAAPRSGLLLGAAAIVATVVAAAALMAGLREESTGPAIAAVGARGVEAQESPQAAASGEAGESAQANGGGESSKAGEAALPVAGESPQSAGEDESPQSAGEDESSKAAIGSEPSPPTVAPRRPARRSAPPPPVSAPPVEDPSSARRNSLAAEHRILDEAKAALAAGNTSLALSLLDEHRRDFPRSPSADIRDLMRVRIHCTRGNVATARTVADQYPSDPQFTALMKRCKA
ncbi:RNA polymerase sigma factor [Nannocystis bainbridge]|uniref:Sigma-70 family RNA polymerase sigma factor n=1 Tax=Nannocystis bainbridge TaxID=2995303 RepID=A0ABT5DTA5_9BACT|nr:sigma-70 family RNA polymerase sigma factor [Nannocystis bainbridge]MDC0716766.1 sigma-70 family RNA polymerase sigma factor [Nannocystis bainbridge]